MMLWEVFLVTTAAASAVASSDKPTRHDLDPSGIADNNTDFINNPPPSLAPYQTFPILPPYQVGGRNFTINPRDTVVIKSKPLRSQPRAPYQAFPSLTPYQVGGGNFTINPRDTVDIKSRPLRYQPRGSELATPSPVVGPSPTTSPDNIVTSTTDTNTITDDTDNIGKFAEIELKCSNKWQVANIKHGDVVTFYSKNYPEKYSPKSKCKWKIMGKTKTTRIIINCGQTFQLQPSKNGKCLDFLQIQNTKDFKDRFCGTEMPLYFSFTNYLKMIFKSNKKEQYPGFICTAIGFDISAPTTLIPTSTTSTPPVAPTCSCGQVNRATRIVGGVETEVNEYPWQVALVRSWSSTSAFCGGSIINEWWILTAAHCAELMNTNNVIVAGEHSWSTQSYGTQKVGIEQILMHPNYGGNSLENDVALIKLATPLSFVASNEVAPICPPSPTDLYENVDAIVTGWGALSSGGSSPDSLQEVVVPTISNRVCQSVYGSYITDDMICAGYYEGGKDSCQGDSGGPLITADGSFYRQIGVVSWGYGCALPGYPGVYARVNSQLQWITSSISGTSWCEPGTGVTSGPINPTPKPQCKCGRVNRQTRIVNGQETEVLEYPWQAVLVNYGGSRTRCGGSLLNSKWVLTAAHCTDGKHPSEIQVILGEHTIYALDYTEQRFDVIQVINHPSYTIYPWTNGHDISLLELYWEVDFSSTQIRPICLPSTQDLFERTRATVTGFGRTGADDDQSLVLMEVDIPVVTNDVCSTTYGSSNIDDTMICAGEGAGTGACMGDSGGPLITSVGDYHVQIGVVSFGSSYCDSLGVYARVTALQSWIESYAMKGYAKVCTP